MIIWFNDTLLSKYAGTLNHNIYKSFIYLAYNYNSKSRN